MITSHNITFEDRQKATAISGAAGDAAKKEAYSALIASGVPEIEAKDKATMAGLLASWNAHHPITITAARLARERETNPLLKDKPLTKKEQIAKLFNSLSWQQRASLPYNVTVDAFDLSLCGKILYLKSPCACGMGCPPELGWDCGGDSSDYED
jgi:hypothetical protein